MGIIKVYLKESGSISKIEKDFQLYKGSYQNNQIDIYVPITILPSAEQHIAGVKTALIITKPNGDQTTTTSYNAELDVERGQVVVNNVTYVVYTQTLPRVFVKYSGEQTLVANVYEIDDNPESSTYEQIVRIITSQTSPLTIQNSEYIDTEEVQDPSQLEYLAAKVNQLDAELQGKQDKIDDQIEIAEGSVVGAINNLDERVESNTEQISTNTSDIAELQDIVGSGEDYVGTYTDTKDPSVPADLAAIKQELTAYVETLRPEVEGSDVVIYIQEVSGGTDKNYKFIYSGSLNDWTYYEIPAIERASNDTYGIIKGTYSVGSTNDVIVDIAGGIIQEIYIKNANGVYNTAKYYVDSAKTSIDNILDGTTPVEKALKAVSDELGNNIVNTYLTQTAGVTKVQLREYALPRTFNDVSYLTSTGYSNTIPESASPVYTVTSTSVGDHELFSAEKTIVNSEFELSEKNSSVDTIYVSASAICNVQFRLTTEINVDNTWNTASVELSDTVQFSAANEIKKLTFGSTFAALEEVLKLTDGDKIRQTLEVITSVSSSITFNVYSNETYPSTFYLNTTSQTIYVAQGRLGELPKLELTGTYDSLNDNIEYAIPVGFEINNNVQAQFILTIPQSESISEETTITLEQGSQNIDVLVIPAAQEDHALPTLKDIESATVDDEIYFTGLFLVNNGNIGLITSITKGGDELPTNLLTTDTDQTITGTKTINGKPLVFKHSDNGHALTLEADSDLRGILKMNGTELLRFVGQYGTSVSVALNALNDNSIDLGKTGNRWRDLYLSRNLTDGTNSITIADIANKNDVLIRPLNLTTTTMTDEQIATLRTYNCVLTNDLVLGTTSLKAGSILTVPFEYSGSLRGIAIYNNKIMTYYINLTSKQISDGAKDMIISQVANINTDKVTIDNYTINKDSFGQLIIGNNNATSIQFDGNTVRSNNLVPMGNNSKDLGSSGQRWKDVYLAGNLSDGTNSVSIADITTNISNVGDIQNVIPAQASSSNPLADKDFVNSTVQTATANFRGNWATWSAVPSVVTDYPTDYAGSKTPTVNDYLVVQDASGYTGQTLEGTWRFKYTGEWATDGKNGWLPEYQVNETPLTAAQLAALNSGITSAAVAQIGTNTTNIALKQNSTDNTLATDDKTIVGSINEIVGALGSLVQDVEDGFTGIAGELNGKQAISNLVTSLSSSSTDAQYPSAKCVYDLVGDVETLLTELNSGQGV